MKDLSKPVVEARSGGADERVLPARRGGWRMRVAGVSLGSAGLLLAAATTVWPTTVFAVRVPEVGDFTKGYEQQVWSWGRQVVYSTDGLVLDAFTGPYPVPRLVLLVVVLLLGVAGVVAWVVLDERRGEVAAAAGLGLALASVAASLVERLSFDERSVGLQPGLVEVTTPTGWLELASVLVLLAALAVLVVPVVLPGPTAALVDRLPAGSARHVATLRDTPSPDTTHTPAVGFRDDQDGRPSD